MPGNTDEKEKCLEKLNEMQKFLPFLDFMIDKIKKKNDLPLECQLSKFQHIRSAITEKNGKYGLESLYNIEDVLLKLISKLDYKGISVKEKKELIETKSEAAPLSKADPVRDERVPESSASVSSASVSHDGVPNVSSKVVESSNSILDVIMKTMEMPVVHSPRQDEKKEEIMGCKDNKIDPVAAKTEDNSSNAECSMEKSKGSEDLSGCKTQRKEADCVINSAPLDVLASSRKKLLKSVSGRNYVGDTESNRKKIGSIDSSSGVSGSGRISSSSSTDASMIDSKEVEDKGKNVSVCHKLLIGELSDISDDEYFVVENVESDQKSADNNETDRLKHVKESNDMSAWSRETSTKFDWKYNEPATSSGPHSLSDGSSKQKLRERLSADIAEVHKVPGRSVGGSLRSLKDLKSGSHRKKLNEGGIDYRSNSPEKLNDSESEYITKKSNRAEKRNRGLGSKDRERRRGEKTLHRSRELTEDRKGHSTKHSSRSEGKSNRPEEQEKDDMDEGDVYKLIDSFDDKELLAFVNENMSDLPNLSTMSPGEMRRAVRQSYTKENLNFLPHEIDYKNETKDNEKSTSPHCSGSTRTHKATSTDANTKLIPYVAGCDEDDEDDDNDDYDNGNDNGHNHNDHDNVYGISVTEDINKIPKTRLEPQETETKRPVPEIHTRENLVENRDPRTRHPSNLSEPQSDNVHPTSDLRIIHRAPKPLKSPTEPAVSRKHINSCDPRMVLNSNFIYNEKQSFNQYFQPQWDTIYDANANNSQRHQGAMQYHPRVPGHMYVRHPCEAKFYGQYKQLKRHEIDSANRLRLSLDDRIISTDSLTLEETNPEAKSKQTDQKERNYQKESEVKGNEALWSPPLKKPSLSDNTSNKNRVKTTNPKFGTETHIKTVEDDRNKERIDKYSTSPVSILKEELVSPLDKLYENDSKPTAGRCHDFHNVEIPKKSRNTPAQPKADEKGCLNKSCSADDSKTNWNESELGSHAEDKQECEEIKKDKTDMNVREQKVNSDEIVNGQSTKAVPKDDAREIEVQKVSSDNFLPADEKDTKMKGKTVFNSDVHCELKDEADFASPIEQIQAAQVDRENIVMDSGCDDNESEKFGNDTKNCEKNEKENDAKTNGESDVGNKSAITEEITQELVEALIRKSFESGEGELLLAKAKLFKELALKLNSKKLKTIQRIINSESDSSSSSSRSSTESMRKKKKKKRICDEAEKNSKKSRREKKTFKSKEYFESSSENESETCWLKKSKALTKTQMDLESAREKNEVSQSEGESPTKLKKSQRKTKLLEQIYNESPAKDFDLSIGNQNPSEKESDQKSKTKTKSKGKTELDRLHDDIRNMFISSGTVTATGQRMCRMLRESGGRMNNLDLVKESAKMVEEEKLASRRSKRLTNTRSRSRSTDRKSVRDRSRSRSLLSGHDDDTSKVLRNQPVVVLERLNLQKMSYAYKIAEVPHSFARRRGRNVARRGRVRGFGLRSTRDEEMYYIKTGRVYLTRNLRRCLARSKTRKKSYRGKKLIEIIEKLPLKMAKIRHLEIGSRAITRNSNLEREKKQESQATNKKRKGEYIVEESSEILDYAFEKSKCAFSCLLCGFHTKAITSHYKTEHPDSEVLISRLEKSEAIKAVQDSKSFNYDITALEQACSLEMIKKRVKQKLTGQSTFFCRMCNYGNVTNLNQFYSHVSTHTGEYRYKCPVEGCDLAMPSRDNVRNHVLSKHQKQKSLMSKGLELFPLPSEHGILFGYLCSRCNFVQVLKRNVESHIQRVHGGVEDVRAIKIDLSGKAKEEKEIKKRLMKRKGKIDGDGEESTGKDEDDDDEDYDPADEDYMYESDAGSKSSISNDDDDDEDFKANAVVNGNGEYQPRRTRSSAADEGQKPAKETPNVNRSNVSKKINEMDPVNRPNPIRVKQEVLSEREDDADASAERAVLDIQNKYTVGPLVATISSSGIIIYKCCVGQCTYSSHLFSVFEGHVLSNHYSTTWTGICESCDVSPIGKEGTLPRIYKSTDLLSHLESHIKPTGSECTFEKFTTVKSELHHSADLDDPKSTESGNEDTAKERIVFPQVPLLRVRSLIGDRLSKPKSLSEEEQTPSELPSTLSESVVECDKANSEPLFTIKDVRSLNPDTEDSGIEEISFHQGVPGSFPPNAEVIAGKPVLIRSCPSPKIKISSEPSPIPISVTQAKQGMEVSQLVKVVPTPAVTEVPSLGINQLGFVATTSIRILSPGAFTTQTVIVPTFTTTSCLVPVSKTTETTPSLTQSRISAIKPVISKTLVPSVSVGSDVIVQKVEGGMDHNDMLKKKKESPPLPNTSPKPIEIQAAEMPTTFHASALVKRGQQYAAQFTGKNLKEAKIYEEMLTKTKLCQLFKCMAVECSFTCNNETIFTQHLGLHEAQQRIKGKKKPNKLRRIFTWQQCAYCCEVVVHSGSVLSQHVLSDHGHCLYQCAYCFYRAVSPTYVDLHQNTVHEKTIKEKKKLIYKCKPVPGAVLNKQFDKQIKPQHIRPYMCEHCGSKFLIIQHFLDHMTKYHQSVTAYTCHICKILCFKADRLIAHYKLHSYSMYQCAYCLHGTENQKEMLYHLWNFHFSQPPVIYARILEDPSKSDNVAWENLKLITFDNEPSDGEHNLEEVGSEAEPEAEKKDAEPVPISVDLSAIVSELGINVDEPKTGSLVAKGTKETKRDTPSGLTVEAMLPNAQFSSESDAGKDNTTMLISSTLASVINQEKKDEKDVSVPIGQLPIEVLEKLQIGAQKRSDENEKESVDKIIMSLQQKNSSVTVSPVVENKVGGQAEESTPQLRSLHKLPPTVPVNRSVVARVYQPKKVAIVKKVDDGHVKDSGSLLFKQLCNTPRISSDLVQPQNVILAVPVVENVKTSNIHGKGDAALALPNQNAVTLKRTGEVSDSLKKTNDSGVLKRFCLGSPSSPAMITISTLQETPLRISDVRSLSKDKETPVVLQPPIIRVEDFNSIGNGKTEASGVAESPDDLDKNSKQNSKHLPQEKNLQPPSSPEVIFLDSEEDAKESRNEVVVIDSEDDVEVKKEENEEETKKVMTDNDIEIRKQMEQLRNQMQNETDCLLLDDDGIEDGKGITENVDKSEDSNSCFPTPEETNITIQDQESASFDSQQTSEASSNKMESCEENIQDGDSRTNDSEDSKSSKTEDSQSATEKSEEHGGELNKKNELTGKELYLCGNENCNFAAESSGELKDHLYICDYSRESTVLICPHCSKHFRHIAPYSEHLKRHGEKKYSCGLCNLLSPVESSITQHLKKKHKCSQVKILPNAAKPGHFVMYPKNHKKEKQDGEVHVYSPGDEDKLPLQSIYQDNVNCAKCPYFTKVRSNMVRHLKIHIKSVETEGSIVVPSTAPTNPVPCLDTKERMFDKMTNLAASSQLAQANKDKSDTLSPEEEAKLPQFVPEQMRHKCCSPDCNYLTIDDNMLKHHIKALHDEINVYSCPHCRETVHLEFRYVPLDKIGQHLKYHDSRLYKCYHCTYFHHQKYVVEKHAMEKHPERRLSLFTVREPKTEAMGSEEEQQQQQHPTSNESVTKMWKCGLCDNFESTVRMSVLEHLAKVHNMKSKFKCKFCDTKSSQYSAFAAHFASKHNGQKVECLKALIQVNKPGSESGQNTVSQETSNEHFDTTPLWQRDAPRIRHIRGILIEEEEIKTKKTKKISSDTENEEKDTTTHPPDMFYCPLCMDKKKVYRSKSAETFRTHLYQELNYQQYACILCGKMFVDRKDCERHHVRAHPNRTLSIKQTKEDSEIKFWVDKVVAKQQAQITERKRKISASDTAEDVQSAKKKKIQAKPVETAATPVASPKKKPEVNRLTRSNSSVELTEPDRDNTKRRSSEEKPDFVRQTRSGVAVHGEEPLKNCPHCEYKVNSITSLKNHIKLRHLKMGKWLCPYCGESFQLEKHVTKHCRSNHPDDVPKAEPNPDEQCEELKDDFWLVEYGFGRDKQTKASEGEKPAERPKATASSREITKSGPSQETESVSKPQPENTNTYSCGYCMLEVTDQSSIVEHFETHHKNIQSEPPFGVTGTIYYQCSVCAEKLIDYESLNVHAKEKHPNLTLQFAIRKVYKYDKKDSVCQKCTEIACECFKLGHNMTGDKAKDGSYQCPRCPMISTSYLDCIDHFNEHYPRYACSQCNVKFFTEAEIEEHQNEYKHKMPYAMTIPSENMLEDYKAGVKVKKNGVWQPLQTSKRSNSSDDSQEIKKVKSVKRTARKSTTQVPERRGCSECDSRKEDVEVCKGKQSQKNVTPPPQSDVHLYFFKDEF